MKQGYRINRLAKKEEAATVKRIFALSTISALLVLFMFTLGIPILGKFADFLELILGSQNQQQSQEGKNIPPPNLDPIPAATNSANLNVRGFAAEGGAEQICGWVADSFSRHFKDAGTGIKDIGVSVASNISVFGPSIAEMERRWWLVSGDTDFK